MIVKAFLCVFNGGSGGGGGGGARGPRQTYQGGMVQRGGRAVAQRVFFGAAQGGGRTRAMGRASRDIANRQRMANARAAASARRGAR